ncbi:MAG: S26 family signal peptidase [bacterium]
MRSDDDSTRWSDPPRRGGRGRSPDGARRKPYVGHRAAAPGAYRKRAASPPDRAGTGPKHKVEVEPITDYEKRPDADAKDAALPSPWVAAGLALAFSGLGQIYNGRWLRGVLSMALPALLLGAAANSSSFSVYLMAFGSGALTAPTVISLLAGAAGWLPLHHPAFWMGLPIKVAVVAEAALDAYRARRLHRVRVFRRWTIPVYVASGVVLLLIWMFTVGFATVRKPGMNPVLEPGDRVVVNRLAFGVQIPLIGVRVGGPPIRRGDRVAVLDPDGSGQLLIRRVFAVAGEGVDFGPAAGPWSIRQPMLDRGEGVAVPVLWEVWGGPCVYALEVAARRKGASYARCRAFVERAAKRAYVVSYPIQVSKVRQGSYKRGRVGKGKVYLLADNRGTARDSRHWGAVSTRAIRGGPGLVLWSSDPLEGIRWHRMGLRVVDRP